jgi:hypothetical protein
VRPEHPITYGYEGITSVFRGNGPLWDVDKRDRGRVVLQFGTKDLDKEEKEEEEKDGGQGEVEVEDIADSEPDAKPEKKEEAPKKKLVLSGFVRNESEVDGKPAILDLPVEKGRVILFAFNPLHRYLNLSDFRLVYNALLHWNDLPE